MAGIGVAPKDPSQRRNRTPPARGEWVDLSPLEAPVLPELPSRAEGSWNPMTLVMWEAWRADPVTSQYSPADVAFALDTILKYDAGKPANELRLRMDGLGLTPKGKRDLRWRVALDAVVSKPRARRSPAAASRQARLSVVK